MKKFKSFYTTALALVMTSAIIMTGCTSSKSDSKKKATTSTEESSEKETEQETTERVLETYDEPKLTGTEVPLNIQTEENVIDDKYRNYYEIFVASFCDSDGDGMGDIQGLISKLDYINDGDPTTDDDKKRLLNFLKKQEMNGKFFTKAMNSKESQEGTSMF